MNATLRFMAGTLAALAMGLAIVYGAKGQDAHLSPEADATAEVVDLSPDAVNFVEYRNEPIPEGRGALILKLQVVLDRAGFSPGVIDGIMGSNVSKAIIAAEATAGLPQDGRLDADLWRILSANAGLSDILCMRPVSSLGDEALAEDDGELRSGLEPFARRSFPIGGSVIEDQI